MSFEFFGSESVRNKIPQRTLVVRRTRNGRKVVWNAHLQTKRFVEQFCGDDDDSSQREWTPNISRDKCVGPSIFDSKGGGKLWIHHNDDPTTLFRMIISVNQLSVYGAVSDWCEELAQHSSSSTGRPVAEMNDESESRISPNVVSILTNPLSVNVPVQGDLLRRPNKGFENLPEDIRVSKACEDAGVFFF